VDDELARKAPGPGEASTPIQARLDAEAASRRYSRRIFGENLSRLMDERGVKSGEVASALGVAARTVRRWRAGEAIPHEGAKLRALARLLDVPRTRLTEWPMLGRRPPANHSPDLVTPQDRGPFVRGYRLRVTEDQEWAIAHLAKTRGITREDAIRWYLNLGRLFAAMRRMAQHMDREGFPEAYRLARLLDETERRGFRIEEVGDLELIYP
jgi:transcriptional regulator with XRE-family HTH domain